VSRVGLQRHRAELIEAHHHPVGRAGAVQRHDAGGLFLERRFGWRRDLRGCARNSISPCSSDVARRYFSAESLRTIDSPDPQNAGYYPTGTAGALAYHTADAIVTRYLPSPAMLA
jgi:hypothetical protein